MTDNEIIKALEAEIERYKGVIKLLERDVANAKTEGVKEFTHLLIDKAEPGGGYSRERHPRLCNRVTGGQEMTEQEMLEAEKYWCENCCNWDKEQVQMDGYAKCKLTGTLCFAQESGKECKCFNVPAENVIVPPCRVGDAAYFLIEDKVAGEKYISPEPIVDMCTKGFYTSGHDDSDENGDLWLWSDVGRIVFLDKAKAEQALKGGVQR